MQGKPVQQYRFRIVISVLFTVLIVLFGLLFGQFIFWRTSTMLLEQSRHYFSQIHDELSLDFNGTRKTVAQTLSILGTTPVVSAMSLERRLEVLPTFQASLLAEQNLTALQVGYDNGDYFIVRVLRDDVMRKQFNGPQEASLVVDNISRKPDGRGYLQRFWFSPSLEELQRGVPETTDYDPRLRPWYTAALEADRDIRTAPYLFHFIGQMGVTIARRAEGAGSVVAGDVTLYHLSETLAKYRKTASSELILLEKKDQKYWVTAYGDPEKLVMREEGAVQRSRVRDLDRPVLDYAAEVPDVLEPFYNFSFEKTKWLGSTVKFGSSEVDDLYLVMLSPEDELLSEARRLRTQTVLYTAMMILLTVPLTWVVARKISSPMQLLAKETQRISRFEFGTAAMPGSFIKEVDELGQAMTMMEATISQFLSLISSLAGEQDFDKLLHRITEETMAISGADAAFTYIVDDAENSLVPGTAMTGDRKFVVDTDRLPIYGLAGDAQLAGILSRGERTVNTAESFEMVDTIREQFGVEQPLTVISLPLENRLREGIGVLCLVYGGERDAGGEDQAGRLAFIDALSGFAAVTLESRKMLKMQKELLESFIKLLAGAIDSKSPYTGGHCQRVPVLTKLLARRACESAEAPFGGFDLSDEQWEAIHIASWLHDCGKVTTPEFVVDKATKLETICDRIHEVRMRFEVLKRDAHIHCLQEAVEGGDLQLLRRQLEETWQQLDEEYGFIAECNLGGEFMAEEKIERLQRIARRTWMRTLDDRLGISWEERQRKEREPAPHLPVEERLLADRYDHLFTRGEKYQLSEAGEYGFILDVPDYLYNRGELHNLSVARGTLTEEERYQINDHIVQTIIMLKKLPYPKHLAEVPDIAGGHHEKIDGTGYPRRLVGDQMSLAAKMMVIADIFEALTASDRPYKKMKKLSEAVEIMGYMEKDHHIDPDLFRLFLSSGAYLEYAREYLLPEQVDEVDIKKYI
jgi:HD-GYP domain-containing protein (c-di-GMP phosphodiesterase class II)